MDENWPEIPPVRKNLENAEIAMKVAVEQISSGKRDAVISSQTNALDSLTKLSNLVDQWSVELGLRTLGLSTLVTKSMTGHHLSKKSRLKWSPFGTKRTKRRWMKKMLFPLPRSNVCWPKN